MRQRCKSDVIMSYSGFRVYPTIWKDDCISEFWYSLLPGLESCDEGTFDVRDLPIPTEAIVQKYRDISSIAESSRFEHLSTIAWAIDTGALLHELGSYNSVPGLSRITKKLEKITRNSAI